jgi:hypothetical protein
MENHYADYHYADFPCAKFQPLQRVLRNSMQVISSLSIANKKWGLWYSRFRYAVFQRRFPTNHASLIL